MILIHTDGGCRGNPGPGGYGVIILCDKLVVEIKGRIERCTNNQAEYHALIAALKWAVEHDVIDVVLIRSDSQLMVRQMQGVYRCKSEELKPLQAEARRLSLLLKRIPVYEHIPREENRRADKLANLAMDEK